MFFSMYLVTDSVMDLMDMYKSGKSMLQIDGHSTGAIFATEAAIYFWHRLDGMFETAQI